MIYSTKRSLRSFKMYSDKITQSDIAVKVGVGLIILNKNGRILLERRRDNAMWGLPGGAIEPGESIAQAGIREAKEETNLDIIITRLLGAYSDPGQGRIVTYPDDGAQRHLVDIILVSEITAGKLAISEESIDLVFFRRKNFQIRSPLQPNSRYVTFLQDYPISFDSLSGYLLLYRISIAPNLV